MILFSKKIAVRGNSQHVIQVSAAELKPDQSETDFATCKVLQP